MHITLWWFIFHLTDIAFGYSPVTSYSFTPRPYGVTYPRLPQDRFSYAVTFARATRLRCALRSFVYSTSAPSQRHRDARRRESVRRATSLERFSTTCFVNCALYSSLNVRIISTVYMCVWCALHGVFYLFSCECPRRINARPQKSN